MHKRYGNQVEFLAVYVREAHPTEGWRMPSNDRVGIRIAQPQSKSERVTVAAKCCSALEITMPVLVDEIDDRVGHLYSGMPDRLYLIDRDGRIAYKGGRGPFGFKARELEQSLVMLLLDQANPPGQTAHSFPILDNESAWKKLPTVEKGTQQPLPVWARALADTLPRTTAAMLELDYLHRAKSPLDPKLRGLLRWTAAHANRCAYTEAQAAADLRRAGLDETALKALGKDDSKLSTAEKAALNFARKMSEAADTVTDAEVSQLMGHYGDKQVVAMVLLLAYANFQDRLILSLGVQPESGNLPPPLEVRFKPGSPVQTRPRTGPEARAAASRQVGQANKRNIDQLQIQKLATADNVLEAKVKKLSDKIEQSIKTDTALENSDVDVTDKRGLTSLDTDWLSLNLGDLKMKMESQRAREPRILVPTWEEVRQRLPGGDTAKRPPTRIRWSLVCMGYQPDLTLGWFACTSAFAQEAKQDRVFEESLFWVITRTLNCFY